MKFFVRALSAELLKLKRTLALWMVFVAPLVVVGLQFFMVYDRVMVKTDQDAWFMYVQSIVALWAVFMLPLFITLETALSNGIEHSAKSWKQLFALPVPRVTLYSAKLLLNFLLIAVSCLILYVMIIASAKLLCMLKPELNMTAMPPFQMITQRVSFVFLGSWFIIALHSWISARWQSFALTLGIGIGAVFFAVFASGARFGKFYPWLLPLNTISNDPERIVLGLTLGILGGIIVAVLGCWDIVRRDVL